MGWSITACISSTPPPPKKKKRKEKHKHILGFEAYVVVELIINT